MSPSLSVMVMTSPGRENLLARCLQRLAAQTDTDFELLVVDDGSEGAAKLVEAYELNFPEVVYLWRDNDHHVSISRNLGAATAQGQWLVSIDSDILLNPSAIAAYRDHADKLEPSQLVYGYYGHDMQVSSQWYPEVSVNWADSRFLTTSVVEHERFKGSDILAELYEQSCPGLWTPRSMRSEPELYAAGGNFMMHSSVCRETGGFDESMARWEDLCFGKNLSRNQLEIHFSSETWGEHQSHDRHMDWTDVHKVAYLRFFDDYSQIQDITYELKFFCDQSALAELDHSCETYMAQAQSDFSVFTQLTPLGAPPASA